MTDYSTMSDKEINLAVHEAIIGYKLHPYGRKTYWYEGKEQQETTELPDYCNNPADAWPIILNNRIAIRSVDLYVGGHTWFAEVYGEPTRSDKNPLRAAMVVFLMMRESADANS